MALESLGSKNDLSRLRRQLADSLLLYDRHHHWKDLPINAFEILSQMSPETQKAIGIVPPIDFTNDEEGNPKNSVPTITLQSLQYWASAPEPTTIEIAQEKLRNAIRAVQQRFRNAFPKKALEVIASV